LDMKLHPGRYVHFSLFGKNERHNRYSPPDSVR
jgi:hypothetical protein